MEFTGSLTLTHNANSLFLPTEANITTAAGDVAEFISRGGGNWKCTGYQRADGSALIPSKILQVIEAAPYTTATSISTVTPADDTIPQITEGVEIQTLTITPKSVNNRLRFRFACSGGVSGGVATIVMALHQDAIVNAIAAKFTSAPAGMYVQGIFTHEMVAGTTNPTTFRLRIGVSANTFTLNGSSGTRILGGVSASSFSVEEVAQ